MNAPAHGHAAHFLSRLDRIEQPQVELALALYEHPALLEATLRQAHLPAEAERVAISLDHPTDGPFIIVTRTGHFVTCLGAGMSPHPLPVIDRQVLDRILLRVRSLHDAVAAAREEARKGRGRVAKLCAELVTAGPYVTRETMEALGRWQIVLGPLFVHHWLRVGAEVAQHAPRIDALARAEPRHERPLRAYHGCLHTLAHLSVLAAGSEAGVQARSEPSELSELSGVLRHAIVGVQMTCDAGYVSLRALWGAGLVGSLEVYAQQARTAQDLYQLAQGMLGTAAIGLRQPDARACAIRAIETARPSTQERARIAARVPLYRATLRMAFSEPERLSARALARGRALYAERAGVPEEEVSDSIALAALASAPRALVRTDDADVLASAAAMGVLAKCAPHELYLPRAEMRAWRRPWQLADGAALIVPRQPRTPVRAPQIPGRNDRCACGSGQKYKRCCIAAPARRAA